MTELNFLKEQITKHQLDNNSRHRSYVYKRYYIMYRLNKCKVSLTQIGKMLNRHHATVIYGIRMHRRWSRMQDKVFKEYMTAKELAEII
jgi:chromosomal replication initiation ATPase DnaA